MPAAATAATSSGTRTTLSLREYSVCSRRWTKPYDIGGELRLAPGICQGILALAHGTERAPVQPRGRAPLQGGEVRGRAVAFVRGQLETRIARIERLHHGIAVHLRQDRSRADGRHARIPRHDGFERARERQVGDARTA